MRNKVTHIIDNITATDVWFIIVMILAVVTIKSL